MNSSLNLHFNHREKKLLRRQFQPGWCSARPGRGSAGCTQTLFFEKMISPSRPERNAEPPAPGLKVRRSEALEEARRRSRPRDISSGTRTLGPSSEYGDVRVKKGAKVRGRGVKERKRTDSRRQKETL